MWCPGSTSSTSASARNSATEADFRAELKKAGFGSSEEYRRTLLDEAKRAALQQKVVDSLKHDGKLVPVGVTEADIDSAYCAQQGLVPAAPGDGHVPTDRDPAAPNAS